MAPDPQASASQPPEPAATPVPPATPAPAGGINETVFYEGGPARGDLIVNLFFGLTLIGLPFLVGALVRALWLRFRITSRRVSVTGGWLGRDRTQVVYSQIREVRSVPRGFGAWGDMVLVLTDGTRLEMRSVPRFREVESFIEEQRRLKAAAGGTTGANGTERPSQGFGEPTRRSA